MKRPYFEAAFSFILITTIVFFCLSKGTDLERLSSYWLSINLAAIFVFGIDKFRARSNGLRVPELTLIIFSLLGGAAGILMGIPLCRHKTRKPSFIFIISAIFSLQVIVYSVYGLR